MRRDEASAPPRLLLAPLTPYRPFCVYPHGSMPNIKQFDRFAFVVGAPRCGTTAIARFLAKHPEIAFSAVKEPHFFSQHDLRGLSEEELKRTVEEEYLGRFFTKGKAGRIGGDGSVSYLYTPEQMEAILRLWPELRFIVAVRDPLAMLPSLHQRLIYIGDETLRISRTRGQPLRSARPDERSREAASTHAGFAMTRRGGLRLTSNGCSQQSDRDRCLVVVFDDLVADPAGQGAEFSISSGLSAIDRSSSSRPDPLQKFAIRGFSEC